jgi:hypothetical protein
MKEFIVVYRPIHNTKVEHRIDCYTLTQNGRVPDDVFLFTERHRFSNEASAWAYTKQCLHPRRCKLCFPE